MNKPKFDPNRPYQPAGKPAFDPNKSFEAVNTGGPEILDERSPDVSFADRAIAKNLAQSPEKQVEFLQKQYPHLKVQLMGSDVLVGDGRTMRKLDPSTLELEDISDLGSDVAAGITSTLGGLGGGMAGAAVGGVGAVPGALAGTAAAGAGTEALRQKLGAYFGIPQEVSATDAALEGGLNAAGALAFGTGKIPGVKEEFKGAIRGAWNTAIPKITGMWTGVEDDVLKTYVNPQTREGVDKLIDGGRMEFTDNLVERIRSSVGKEQREIGERLKGSIDSAGDMVNLSKTKQAFESHIDQLAQQYARVPTPDNKAALDAAKKTYLDNFGSTVSTAGPLTEAGDAPRALIPDEMLPSDAWKLQDRLKDVGDLRKTAGGVAGRHSGNATAEEKAMANVGLDAYRSVGDELGRVTEGRSPELKSQYSDFKDMVSALNPSLRTDQNAYQTFTNLEGKSKTAFREALEKLSKKTGEDFSGDINQLQAADYFGNKSWFPVSSGGTTSTSKTPIAMIAGGLVGRAVGTSVGAPGLGTVVGAGAAGLTAGPRGVRAAIKATDPFRAAADQMGAVMDVPGVTPTVREIIMRSPWLGME
jgi:hypothetical protein